MTLKTGRKCTWKEIKVGEIFAWKGCWSVSVKLDSENARLLATDLSGCFDIVIPNIFNHGSISGNSPSENGRYFDWELEDCYKLSKSIQKLWKEE